MSDFRNFFEEHKVLLLLLWTVLFSLPTFWMYFYSEDLHYSNFPHDSFGKNLKLVFTTDINFQRGAGGAYRPVTTLTNLLDYSIYGLKAFGYHLTSALFHLLTVLLLFFFLTKLIDRKSIAFWTSAIFVLLPVHATSLFWISGRSDIICACFMLLSSWMFLKYVEDDYSLFLLLAQIAFLLAVLSKGMALVLPAVWLIIYFFKGDELEISKIVFALTGNAVVLIAFFFLRWKFTSSLLIGGHPLTEHLTLKGAGLSVAKYFVFLLVPLGHSIINQAVLFQDVIILSLTALYLLCWAIFLVSVFYKSSDKRIYIFQAFLFFILLSPVLFLAHRWYLYIPSAIFCWFLADRVVKAGKFERYLLIIFLAANIISYFAISHIWIENGKLNRRLINSTRNLVKDNPGEKIVLLNFPAKIHRYATFVPGFEYSIDAVMKRKVDNITRLFMVSYPSDYYPPRISRDGGSITFDYSKGRASIIEGRKGKIRTPFSFEEFEKLDIMTSSNNISNRISQIRISGLDKLPCEGYDMFYFKKDGWKEININP